MSTFTTMDDPKSIVAERRDGQSWLYVEDRDGARVMIFMPDATAKAMAEAFDLFQTAPQMAAE